MPVASVPTVTVPGAPGLVDVSPIGAGSRAHGTLPWSLGSLLAAARLGHAETVTVFVQDSPTGTLLHTARADHVPDVSPASVAGGELVAVADGHRPSLQLCVRCEPSSQLSADAGVQREVAWAAHADNVLLARTGVLAWDADDVPAWYRAAARAAHLTALHVSAETLPGLAVEPARRRVAEELRAATLATPPWLRDASRAAMLARCGVRLETLTSPESVQAAADELWATSHWRAVSNPAFNVLTRDRCHDSGSVLDDELAALFTVAAPTPLLDRVCRVPLHSSAAALWLLVRVPEEMVWQHSRLRTQTKPIRGAADATADELTTALALSGVFDPARDYGDLIAAVRASRL